MLIKANDRIFIQTDNIAVVIDEANCVEIKHATAADNSYSMATRFKGQDRLDVLKALNEYTENWNRD